MSTILRMSMKPMNIMKPPKSEDDDAGRQAEDLGRVVEHRIHEVGRGDEQEAGQADRQEADHVARQALLRGQGADLALDPDALADRERDRVEDLGEVAADRGAGCEMAVAISSRSSERTRRTMFSSAWLERQAEVDLADDPRRTRSRSAAATRGRRARSPGGTTSRRAARWR